MERVFTTANSDRKEKIYVMNHITVDVLTEVIIAQHTLLPITDVIGNTRFTVDDLKVNYGVFSSREFASQTVVLLQQSDQLILTCTCDEPIGKLCSHQAEVLLTTIKYDDWRVFFDVHLRKQKFKKFAADYGLENELDLDQFFQIDYQDKQPVISTKLKSLFAANKENLNVAAQQLLPAERFPVNLTSNDNSAKCIVIKQHKYYKHLIIELYDAPRTRDGRIKNPLTPVLPLEMMWTSNDPFELKFFAAVSRFQQTIDAEVSASAITSLKAVVKNPLGLDVYILDAASENVSATALKKIDLKLLTQDIELAVNQQGDFYELAGHLKISESQFTPDELEILFHYFIRQGDTLYLVKDLATLGAINFLKRKGGSVMIHQSQFKDFKFRVLNKVEETGVVKYPGIKPASPAQLKEQGFNKEVEKLIYLSEFGEHVMIVPVMRYGEIEISIRTQKQIYTTDAKGNPFEVFRDDATELAFTALLIKQHPNFEEQLEDDLYYFYLHKKYFLDEEWFLNTFEEWQNHNISILGFNELSKNKLNLHKVKITIQVLSGVNWFNVKVKARFGRQKTNMKSLYKAIRNKSKFVQLDDGTMGILPAEWIAKFTNYFTAAQILDDDTLGVPKINYASITEMYEDEMLDDAVRLEIKNYRQKLQNFESVKEVQVSSALNATLRTYQQEGLNWLNFLDDFNFGGCLADDMGLGKTIQIIAFIL
jgi:hypothetical protein